MAKKKEELTLEEKLEQALVSVDEQPYEVPRNWCWTVLEHTCSDFIVPQRDKPKKFDGDIPWCRIEDIEGKYLNDTLSGQYVSQETVNDMNLRVCPIDTVICSCSASLGIQAILTRECCTNQTFIGLVCNETLNKDYLYYYLKSQKDFFELIGTGTTIKYISKDKFKKMRIPLPPLAEQQRIVDRIESLFAKLDEAKEKIQEVIDDSENREISIVYSAFNGELTKKWRNENNIQACSWRNMQLQECSSKIGDGLHGTPVYDEKGEYFFINGNNLNYDYIEIKDDTKRVNFEEFNKHKKDLDTSTVFVSINGTLGNTAFYNNEPVILGKSACYINVDGKILDKHYLRFYLGSKMFLDYANDKATGSTIKNLGLKAVREMEIKIPTIQEQKCIVTLLENFYKKENSVFELCCNQLEKIDLIKKSILAKAFRGELGTNNTADEDAEALLKSIL